MIKKSYLLTPGPTPIPESVLAASAQPFMHHRTPEFAEIYATVTEGLKHIFQTEEDVYILASSGSGAMEAAVVNILSPGDKALVLNCGKFGDRWTKICNTYGIATTAVNIAWGDIYTKEQLEEEFGRHSDIKAVFSTLSATSTGTVYDIQGYSEVVSQTETLLVVDGISGVGAMPCPMDEWELDVVISGSQKSFMTPPGLAYISFSKKAWKSVELSLSPRFYFDARAARKSLQKKTSPWTPAISLIMQQMHSLDIMQTLGLEQLFEHHRILGTATRAGIQAMGLNLLSKDPGNILTAVRTPDGIDGTHLVKTMQAKYQAYIAGAQDPHKGEFFRIGHLGYIGGFDIIIALSALEMALDDLSYTCERCSAIKAAEDILKENWQ
ncbi:MAG: aminotransferase class V-fold PLP-dependent enzyme [Candidatus Aminicenantes bacterium]|nr:aminotransferase class V-fold PLP-dependent enzyme [Candidatus Aminicenantes bacterium]